MHFITYAHFFSSIIYLYLALYILVKNRYALINRVCAALLFCFCIWSIGVAFANNPFLSLKTARIAENIGAVGWTLFSSFFLWFATIFAGKKKFFKSFFFVSGIFMLPALLLYKQWTGAIIDDYMLMPYGWIGKWTPSVWTYLYWGYYTLMVLASLVIINNFRKATDSALEKKQSNVIILSGILSLILGTASNVVARLLHIYSLPPVGNIFILIWAFGMVYAISRYKLLVITPAIAAEEIVSTMQDILILLDQKGCIVSANKTAFEVLNYTSPELIGHQFKILLHEKPDTADILSKVLMGDSLKNIETLLVRKTGTTIPVTLTTSWKPGSGTVCIARDISLQKEAHESLMKDKEALEARVQERTKELSTANEELTQEIIERRKAEEELKSSEELFKILFEFAPDAYYINDLAGTFINGNKKAEELIGYKKSELIGSSFLKLNLLPLSQMPKAAQLMAKNALGYPTGPDEFVINRKDSSTINLEISTYPIKIANKNLVLGIARDVTQRKQDEEEKRRLEDQLRQAQKMEAIGQLAGGIAHDFNNMLGAISGYADMIKKKFAPENPTLDKYISRVLDAAVRSASLTSKLLAFARRGKYEVAALDMHEIIQSVINLLEHSIDKRISIVRAFTGHAAIIMGDSSQLQNMILNLAVNSIDAMPGGGTLTFGTGTTTIDAHFIRSRQYTIKPGPYVKISVSDTGVGMDDETKNRLFQPFFTTKDPGKGTGLGLASVYGTIKSHDGFIDVESQKEKGSTFTLFLPLTEKPQDTHREPVKKPSRGSGKILIVDDEALIRDIAREIVQEFGYASETCCDGEQAIAYYRDHYLEIDLVILDLIMPKINGHDCFSALKKINPDIKAIVSSGYAIDDEVNKILKEGASGFLKKPFEMNDLLNCIKKALE